MLHYKSTDEGEPHCDHSKRPGPQGLGLFCCCAGTCPTTSHPTTPGKWQGCPLLAYASSPHPAALAGLPFPPGAAGRRACPPLRADGPCLRASVARGSARCAALFPDRRTAAAGRAPAVARTVTRRKAAAAYGGALRAALPRASAARSAASSVLVVRAPPYDGGRAHFLGLRPRPTWAGACVAPPRPCAARRAGPGAAPWCPGAPTGAARAPGLRCGGRICNAARWRVFAGASHPPFRAGARRIAGALPLHPFCHSGACGPSPHAKGGGPYRPAAFFPRFPSARNSSGPNWSASAYSSVVAVCAGS